VIISKKFSEYPVIGWRYLTASCFWGGIRPFLGGFPQQRRGSCGVGPTSSEMGARFWRPRTVSWRLHCDSLEFVMCSVWITLGFMPKFRAFSNTGWLETFSLKAKAPWINLSDHFRLAYIYKKNCFQTEYIYFCFFFNRTHTQGGNKYDFMERRMC
jgi:hypothetical protein